MKNILILASFLLFLAKCVAQTDKEFWFVAPDVDGNDAKYNIPIVIRMSSFGSPASGTITLPADPGFRPIPFSIQANSTVSIDLTSWVDKLQNAPADAILNKGILIQSSADITAYYEVVSSYCVCNPEVFALKGRNALGTEFYISSQNSYHIDTARFPTATTSFDLVATEDHTTVRIITTQPIRGHAATVPFQVILNRGQTYSAVGVYRDPVHHLQGSHIIADKPIAVTLKDDLVRGEGLCADLIGDQTIPVDITGHEYIVAKGYLKPVEHVYVLATADRTSIFLNGGAAASAVIDKGQTWTFDLRGNSAYITGDKDFYVYHVTGAGCELGSAIIPKLRCTGSSNVNIVRSSDFQFAVMLICRNGIEGSFTVNGDPTLVVPANFAAVPGTAGTYVAATIDMSNTFPAGTVIRFSNPAGKFAVGFLDGSGKEGMRYGFFSDFKSSNISNNRADICAGDSVQIHASGGISYRWAPVAGLTDPAIADPKVSPATTTVYRAAVTNAEGCVDSVYENVHVRTVPLFQQPPDENVCLGSGVRLSSGNGPGFVYDWSPAAGLDDPSAPYPVASPQANTGYKLNIRDSICGHDSSFEVGVQVLPVPRVHAGKENDIDCSVHTARLHSDGAISYSWIPTTGLDDPRSAAPIASIDSTTAFIVKGVATNGCYSFDTVVVRVTATGPNTFVVPDAFTPNGDGRNDCFGITRWADAHVQEFSIYNRWGQRVFYTRDPSGCWDGAFRGSPQPADTYIYIIRALTFCGEITRRGTLVLIR